MDVFGDYLGDYNGHLNTLPKCEAILRASIFSAEARLSNSACSAVISVPRLDSHPLPVAVAFCPWGYVELPAAELIGIRGKFRTLRGTALILPSSK
jgi:hypothetical protein